MSTQSTSTILPNSLPTGDLMHYTWDSAFRTIVTGGWANESNGDVESRTGHFARCSITEADLPEFRDLMTDEDLPHAGPWVLTGHFLILENDLGQVFVTRYRTESDLMAVYQYLTEDYDAWHADTDDDQA